jgi:NhaP-type Na+/H+ or K+/H+ antiporter
MINLVGAFGFGLVMGWLTYRTVRRKKSSSLTDLGVILGTLVGATIVSLFPPEDGVFGAYCAGLAVGFFLYIIIFYNLKRAAVEQADEAARDVAEVLGDEK